MVWRVGGGDFLLRSFGVVLSSPHPRGLGAGGLRGVGLVADEASCARSQPAEGVGWLGEAPPPHAGPPSQGVWVLWVPPTTRGCPPLPGAAPRATSSGFHTNPPRLGGGELPGWGQTSSPPLRGRYTAPPPAPIYRGRPYRWGSAPPHVPPPPTSPLSAGRCGRSWAAAPAPRSSPWSRSPRVNTKWATPTPSSSSE